MSILIGYAIPTDIPGADHTYVTSDSPAFNWPCWGRGSGGKKICEGEGDGDFANCLSRPNSWAGIVYGVTGVCHQTANRILYPAKQIVLNARAYPVSVFVYGTYGTRNILADIEWQERIKNCAANNAVNSSSKKETISKNNLEDIYIQKVIDLYSEYEYMPPGLDHIEILKKDFEYLLEFRWGRKTDSDIVSQVQKQQIDLLKEKGKVVSDLFNGNISTERYVKKINDLVRDVLITLYKNLGKDKFEKVFDLPLLEKSFNLIDPNLAKIFLKSVLI
jgi:hypothetical protein